MVCGVWCLVNDGWWVVDGGWGVGMGVVRGFQQLADRVVYVAGHLRECPAVAGRLAWYSWSRLACACAVQLSLASSCLHA